MVTVIDRIVFVRAIMLLTGFHWPRIIANTVALPVTPIHGSDKVEKKSIGITRFRASEGQGVRYRLGPSLLAVGGCLDGSFHSYRSVNCSSDLLFRIVTVNFRKSGTRNSSASWVVYDFLGTVVLNVILTAPFCASKRKCLVTSGDAIKPMVLGPDLLGTQSLSDAGLEHLHRQ